MQIIVLGMHRSGTSAVTRLINMMGANVGTPAVLGLPALDNEKGFWERMDVKQINDDLLKNKDCTWDDIASFSFDKIYKTECENLRAKAIQIIFQLDTHRPWVLKDPRLCLTLPFWLPLLEVPVCVLPYRSPLEVAQSLMVRNGITLVHGIALWEAYTLHALRVTQELPKVTVSYSRLVNEPYETVTELFRDLEQAGVQRLLMPSEKEITAFVEQRLYHQRADDDNLAGKLLNDAQKKLADALVDGSVFKWDSIPKISEGAQAVLDMFSNLRKLEQNVPVDDSSRKNKREESSDDVQEGQELEVVNSNYNEAEKIKYRQEIIIAEQTERLARLQSSLLVSERNAGVVQERLRQAQHDYGILREELAIKEEKLEKITYQLHQADNELSVLAERLQKLQPSSEIIIDVPQEVPQGLEWLQVRHENIQRTVLERINRLEIRIESLDQARGQLEAENKQYKKTLQLKERETAQVIHWLDDAMISMDASFASWRWRIGNACISAVEKILLRGKPSLAKDHIAEIKRTVTIWKGNKNLPIAVDGLAENTHIPADIRAGDVLLKEVLHARNDLPDIIVFPVIDWHFRVQRPQHLATQLGRLGHRVFYLSTSPECDTTEPNFALLENPHRNVYVLQLKCRMQQAPNIYSSIMSEDQKQALLHSFLKFIKECDIHMPAAIIDLPFWRPLVEAIPGALIIYDCMDYHAGFSTNTKEVVAEEKRLLERADVVVTTSTKLTEHVNQQGVESVQIRNAADVKLFSESPKPGWRFSERPCVGYVGAISDWFDIDLIEKAARAYPEWDFVLVGSTFGCSTERAERINNIHFIGEVPYSLVPSYVHGFDVCLIPFLLTDLILATNPVKIYEYLSAGKPVVATALPELLSLPELLHIADNHNDFIKKLGVAMNEKDDEGLRLVRQEWASSQDWLSRGKELQKAIFSQYPKISVIVLTYNNLDYTKACLDSLYRFTDYPNWELIVVDNASTDGSVAFLEEYQKLHPLTKVIFNKENLGFAGGNNVGLKASTGDYLVMLNNDTYVTRGWSTDLIRHLRRDPSLGLVGPVTNNIGNEAKIEIHYGDMTQMSEQALAYTSKHSLALLEANTLGFFCVAMSRSVFESTGLLDEQFELGFFEDDDYCRRIQQQGLKIMIAEDVFVHHHLSASFNKLGQERKAEIFKKNKKIYEEKWGSWKSHDYRKSS